MPRNESGKRNIWLSSGLFVAIAMIHNPVLARGNLISELLAILHDHTAPELTAIPPDQHINVNTGELRLARLTIDLTTLDGTDNLDEFLEYSLTLNGITEVFPSSQQQVEVTLPSGRNVLRWRAQDDRGNVSPAQEQIINVYPIVRFAHPVQTIAEGERVYVRVELSGNSPVYPVNVSLELDSAHSDVNAEDIANGLIVGTEHSVMVQFSDESDQGNSAYFPFSVADDGVVENDERLRLRLISAYGLLNDEQRAFPMTEASRYHDFFVSDDNLPPVVRLQVMQQGQLLDSYSGALQVDPMAGALSIRLQVSDPNPRDQHQLEWLRIAGGEMENGVASARLSSEWLQQRAGQSINIGARVTDSGQPPIVAERQIALAIAPLPQPEPPEEVVPPVVLPEPALPPREVTEPPQQPQSELVPTVEEIVDGDGVPKVPEPVQTQQPEPSQPPAPTPDGDAGEQPEPVSNGETGRSSGSGGGALQALWLLLLGAISRRKR